MVCCVLDSVTFRAVSSPIEHIIVYVVIFPFLRSSEGGSHEQFKAVPSTVIEKLSGAPFGTAKMDKGLWLLYMSYEQAINNRNTSFKSCKRGYVTTRCGIDIFRHHLVVVRGVTS